MKNNDKKSSKSTKFLLQYEKNNFYEEQNMEEFSSLTQVEKRIKELCEETNFVREGIVVYKIKKIMKVEIKELIKIT